MNDELFIKTIAIKAGLIFNKSHDFYYVEASNNECFYITFHPDEIRISDEHYYYSKITFEKAVLEIKKRKMQNFK